MSSVQDDADFRSVDRSSSVQTSTNSSGNEDQSVSMGVVGSAFLQKSASYNQTQPLGDPKLEHSYSPNSFYSGPSLNSSILSSKKHAAQYIRRSMIISSPSEESVKPVPTSPHSEIPTSRINNSPSIRALTDILNSKVQPKIQHFDPITEESSSIVARIGVKSPRSPPKTPNLLRFGSSSSSSRSSTSSSGFRSVKMNVTEPLSSVAADQPDLISLQTKSTCSTPVSVVSSYQSARRYPQRGSSSVHPPSILNDIQIPARSPLRTSRSSKSGSQNSSPGYSRTSSIQSQNSSMVDSGKTPPNVVSPALGLNEPVQRLNLLHPDKNTTVSIPSSVASTSVAEIGYSDDNSSDSDEAVKRYDQFCEGNDNTKGKKSLESSANDLEKCSGDGSLTADQKRHSIRLVPDDSTIGSDASTAEGSDHTKPLCLKHANIPEVRSANITPPLDNSPTGSSIMRNAQVFADMCYGKSPNLQRHSLKKVSSRNKPLPQLPNAVQKKKSIHSRHSSRSSSHRRASSHHSIRSSKSKASSSKLLVSNKAVKRTEKKPIGLGISYQVETDQKKIDAAIATQKEAARKCPKVITLKEPPKKAPFSHQSKSIFGKWHIFRKRPKHVTVYKSEDLVRPKRDAPKKVQSDATNTLRSVASINKDDVEEQDVEEENEEEGSEDSKNSSSPATSTKLRLGDSLFPRSLNESEVQSIMSMEKSRSIISSMISPDATPKIMQSSFSPSFPSDDSIMRLVQSKGPDFNQVVTPDGRVVIQSPAPSFSPSHSSLQRSPTSPGILKSSPSLKSERPAQIRPRSMPSPHMDDEISRIMNSINFSDSDESLDTSFHLGNDEDFDWRRISQTESALLGAYGALSEEEAKRGTPAASPIDDTPESPDSSDSAIPPPPRLHPFTKESTSHQAEGTLADKFHGLSSTSSLKPETQSAIIGSLVDPSNFRKSLNLDSDESYLSTSGAEIDDSVSESAINAFEHDLNLSGDSDSDKLPLEKTAILGKSRRLPLMAEFNSPRPSFDSWSSHLTSSPLPNHAFASRSTSCLPLGKKSAMKVSNATNSGVMNKEGSSNNEGNNSNQPRTSMKKVSVKFSSEIMLYTTYAGDDYDRHPEEDVACNNLTPALATQIKNELNEFKAQMKVDEHSKCYTHFL